MICEVFSRYKSLSTFGSYLKYVIIQNRKLYHLLEDLPCFKNSAAKLPINF